MQGEGARPPLRVENVGACHTPLPEAGGRDCGWDHHDSKKWDSWWFLGYLGTWFGWGEGR